MPELPEVETIASGVNARVRGKRIVSAWFGSKPEPLKSPAEVMAAALSGSRIDRVHRVGKHIVVDLTRAESGEHPRAGEAAAPVWRGQWLVHLGMTGRLLVVAPDCPVPPHTHAIVQLDDGCEIRFVDPRRFGRLALLDLGVASASSARGETADGETVRGGTAHGGMVEVGARRAGFTGPGREPLEISLEAFQALFHGRRTAIKSALLNQSLLHGVGNIYADESLFRAGIRPKRQAARMSRAELGRLLDALRTVLREAISLGGSSVSDYVGADGMRGFFQLQHRVYLRTGEPCLVCGTPIRRIVLGGRGTHYCPHCQR